jgi:hypothetical protein
MVREVKIDVLSMARNHAHALARAAGVGRIRMSGLALLLEGAAVGGGEKLT